MTQFSGRWLRGAAYGTQFSPIRVGKRSGGFCGGLLDPLSSLRKQGENVTKRHPVSRLTWFAVVMPGLHLTTAHKQNRGVAMSTRSFAGWPALGAPFVAHTLARVRLPPVGTFGRDRTSRSVTGDLRPQCIELAYADTSSG